jgi:hypothetical protein
MSSSRYGALPASRCVTDPADIRLLTEPKHEFVEGIGRQRA